MGAGGAIARHREEGDEVAVLILGKGIASREGQSAQEVQAQQESLMGDVAEAHRILATSSYSVDDFPDQKFETVPILSITQAIEKAIEQHKPDLIYTHFAGDVNEDHQRVSRAVEAAARPMLGSALLEVRAFEIASSTEWNFVRPAFHPNVFVSLSPAQLQKKVDAMRAYKGEIREFPHPRSAEYLEAQAKVRGAQSGFHAAEGFELLYKRL